MAELREHPWVTNNNTSPLLPSKPQNCYKMVTEITKEDLNSAVSSLNPVWTVLRAIQRFRTALTPSGSRSASREDLTKDGGGGRRGSESGSGVVGKSSDSLEVPKQKF
ncbi:hypothetical protein HDU98_009729 [Podochytrium sp. JEL0797]|nr:hypothetical protein HDU98_009729 [Podochytrium sp. JEL0797]